MAHRPHPLECILPPYMLIQIAAHGSEAQKDKARVTLESTSLMREQRAAIADQPRAASSSLTKKRVVYTAENTSSLPGRVARMEGTAPTGDPAVDEAFDGAGATYDLFWEVYQRLSIDAKGMAIDSTVHYQVGYDNAFWNGQQMVYGDGDEDLPVEQRLFNRFTIALDVIGHELTHGVTQYTANLTYLNQSGALNEAFSDIFGSLVRQRLLGQRAADADWIIGKGLFTANVQGVGIRSMKAPGTAYDDPVLGKDPQPGHNKDYVNTSDDNGGVHINSGIPNHAFYLAAIEMGGFAWEKMGQIWYVALRDRLGPNASFLDAANLTFQAAGDLYGKNSIEQQSVSKGWEGVGIQITNNPPTANNPGCFPGLLRMLGNR